MLTPASGCSGVIAPAAPPTKLIRSATATLFLDEIGDLSGPLQVKLLRFLQEHRIERVGGREPIDVDVRVIAATNRDLEAAVRAGHFRSDLFYGLNVLPVAIPPLRERREDVPQLVAFFLSRFSRRFGKTVSGVSRETMERLSEYPWPGNVRELQNVVRRAFILAEEDVGVDSLPLAVAEQMAAASLVTRVGTPMAYLWPGFRNPILANQLLLL